MRMRTVTLIIFIFLLALSFPLGYLNLDGIQRVSADNNPYNAQLSFTDLWDAGLLADAPILSPIDNPTGDGSYLVDWSDVTGAISYRLEEADNLAFTSSIVRYEGVDSQFSVTGQPTGLWYYRVLATNGGDGPWSNIESVGVIPNAPVLNSISNPDGNGDYLVDWNDVTGATVYELQEDDNSGFSSPAVRYSGAASQFSVTGQPAGLWYYRVRASNLGGDSAWSNTASVSVAPNAPVLSPISNPDGNGDYLVDWNDVTGATAYELQEDDNSGFSSPAVRYSGATSQFSVTGQATGLWYYRVRASNLGGNSPWSNTVSVGVAPNAPTLSSISNPDGNGDYLVDWNDVTGATAYELQEADNSGFTSPTVRYSGATSQFSVTGQPAGLWYYRVRASNVGGTSAWSNTVSVSVAPNAPVLSPISNPDGNGDYLVDWNDVTGATSYRLEEADNPAFTPFTVSYEGAVSQFSVTGQTTGLWYYRVRASNLGGNSPWSNTVSVSVAPNIPVLSPISNTDGNGDYLVDWNDVTGATSYQLEEADNPTFTPSTIRYEGAVSQFSVTGQPAGLWYYRVRASNVGGNSAWSNTVSVSVIPNAPVLSPISNPTGGGNYLVDWNDVTGATAYELQEDDNSGFTSPTVRYSGAISQFSVTGQATGLWYYRVRAGNLGGNSAWSNTVSVSVVPNAPVLSPISNPTGGGNYLVDWNDVTLATAYELQEDDNSGFTSPTVRYTGAISQFSVTGQPTGLWYYRVRASNVGGNSAWSNTVSVSVIPNAPVLSPISNPTGGGSYLVDWSDVTDATAYELQEDDNLTFTSPTVRYSGGISQFSVTGQLAGLWYYRVRASNLGGNSAWSNTVSVSVIPNAPVLSPISNPTGGGNYLVDWNDVTGATAYELQEDDNTGFTSPAVRYSGAISQFSITGQLTGLWYYRVRASNLGGNSPWSNTVSVSVIPNAPVLSPISNPDGNGDYLVDWNDVTGATAYELQEDDNSGFTSPTVRYSGATSQFSVTGQPTGLWYYRVRAGNLGGNSAWSNTVSVSVIPNAPVLSPISNSDGNGDYLVDWSDVTGATAYELQEDDNSGFTSPTVRYSGAISQFSVTGHATGLWYYRVRASNLGGNSPWSNTVSVSVIPNGPVLSPISNPDGNGDYLVDWSDVASATSYELQEDDNSGFTSPTVRYSGAVNQFQVIGQPAGLWYYRVRASNVGGNSAWSNTESVSILPDHFLPMVYMSTYGVQVLPNSYSYVLQKTLFIIGEVLNNTTDSLTWVEVTVNFFDVNRNLVGTGHSYMWPLDLPPWEKGCFSISMNIPPGWSYYQFEPPTYNLNGTSLGLTIINSNGFYTPASKDYDIVGQVRNDGSHLSNSVAVSGTLYNLSGVPVGCEYRYVSTTNLNPGQSSSFAIKYSSFYRDYYDVNRYELRVAGDLP